MMRRKTFKLLIGLLFTFLLWTTDYGLSAIYAQVPHLINYQGRFSDSDRKVLEGSYDIIFKIYDVESGGAPLWQEHYPAVIIRKGIFSVILGSVTSLNLPFDKPYFLEIQVGKETMSPRQRIASVGYAINAEHAESADYAKTADRAAVADTITNASSLFPQGGIILCKNSCPAGYKRVSDLENKFLVGGSSFNPSAGGSNYKTLTVENMPSHSHSMSHSHNIIVTRAGSNNGGLLMTDFVSAKEQSGLVPTWSGNSSSVGSSASFDIRPEYATIILCEKE